MVRRVVLDTETTGLDPKEGHRIIEIGCIELNDRSVTGNHWHAYLNPGREIDEAAQKVHGINTAFLEKKPYFYQVIDELMAFLEGAQLVIHNAPFDIGFLNYELGLLPVSSLGKIEDHCQILDTLSLARKLHPGQRNSLDALCKRYAVNIRDRALHGALLDAKILTDVYLAMTGGQISLAFTEELPGDESLQAVQGLEKNPPVSRDGLEFLVVVPDAIELLAHQNFLKNVL